MAIRWGLRRSVLSVVTAGILVFLLGAFVIGVFTVSSDSMSPGLLRGDSVLVNRVVYRLHPPRRGDIIVFHFPQAGGREFVKRVVGLPGDVVKEQEGRLYLNGTLLAQAPAMTSTDTGAPGGTRSPRPIPAGRLYVLGDNPGTSLDSRFWGTVTERDVVGEAVLICWSRGKHWWDVRWDRVGRWLR